MMKTLVYQLQESPRFQKALVWGKLITLTGGTQLFVQFTGFLSGILIIRLLPTQQYALYTLANTMLGTMTILADSGISTGTMAEGGKVWQNRKDLGVVMATGLRLRRKFGGVTLLVTMPVLAYLLLSHGAGLPTTALIILAVIPAFLAGLSDSLLELVPKLHQDIAPLQKNGAEVSVGRLLLSAIFLFVFPFTFLALLANGLPRIYGNIKLRQIAARSADLTKGADPVVRKQINRAVNRTLPIVIYHCLSAQLSIWLISLFGTTTSIAQIGALGRLAVLFNLFSILFSTLVVPRFSRMNGANTNLLKPYALAQLLALSLSAVLLTAVSVFSGSILWLLGGAYSGLRHELFLVGIASGLTLLNGVCSQLVLSRGWYPRPYFLLGLNFLSTVTGLFVFNLSSLKSVLQFNIAVDAVAFAFMFLYGLLSIQRTRANNQVTES